MAQGKPKYYLTTPIYYTNGLPHIGHTYSTIVCDAIRRYKRMLGYEVVLTTGTDEHGVNVERSAKNAGRLSACSFNSAAMRPMPGAFNRPTRWVAISMEVSSWRSEEAA